MSTTYNRREFIRRMAGVGAGAAVGLGLVPPGTPDLRGEDASVNGTVPRGKTPGPVSTTG
jgi:hypothetical protein